MVDGRKYYGHQFVNLKCGRYGCFTRTTVPSKPYCTVTVRSPIYVWSHGGWSDPNRMGGWSAWHTGRYYRTDRPTDRATLSISFHCRSFECIGNNWSIQEEMHSKSAKCENVHYYYLVWDMGNPWVFLHRPGPIPVRYPYPPTRVWVPTIFLVGMGMGL